MNPLIAVIAYCEKDRELTLDLLKWISELGGCLGHSCLLVADSEISQEQRKEVSALAKKSFDWVGTVPVDVPIAGHAPNHMFLAAAKYVYMNMKLPWLWLEPDCVPLKPDWLDSIAEEYARCPRMFMGALVEADQPPLPKVHLIGCSVYSQSAWLLYDSIKSLKTENVAFDMEGAAQSVPRSKHTNLIHQVWGTRELAPEFAEAKTTESPKNTMTLSDIPVSAVLFHRSKNGKLIEILRKKKSPPVAAPTLMQRLKSVASV